MRIACLVIALSLCVKADDNSLDMYNTGNDLGSGIGDPLPGTGYTGSLFNGNNAANGQSSNYGGGSGSGQGPQPGGVGNGMSMPGSGGGPFSSAANGNGPGNGVSGTGNGGINPFNAGNGAGPGMGPNSGSNMGPNSGGGAGMGSPFSTGAKGSSAKSPFAISSNAANANPFSSNSGQGVDFGNMGGRLATNLAVGNPMEASSLAGTSGGPGGLTGSVFSIDNNGGPGGLTGGDFTGSVSTNYGPGGLAGGDFVGHNAGGSTSGEMANLNSNSLSALQVENIKKYDTAKYEQLLAQLFNENNYGESMHTGGSVTYASGSGTSTYSSSGHSSAGSLSGGAQVDEPGPFDTRPFQHSQSPFSTSGGQKHVSTSGSGSYMFDGTKSLGGANLANVGLTGGSYSTGTGYSAGSGASGVYTGSSSSGVYAGSSSSGIYSGSSSSGTFVEGSIETPFDKHVDNYNSLISNPFQSQVSGNSQSYSSGGSSLLGDPFSETGTGSYGANPAGDPFRQGGRTMTKAGPSNTNPFHRGRRQS